MRRYRFMAWSSLLLAGVPGRLAAQRPLAIEGVSVVDGVGEHARAAMTIVVEGRRIVAIGRIGVVRIPSGAGRIDARGLVAIPGLWDMHVHLEHHTELPWLLEHGITSVRDMGSVITSVKPWRDSIAAGTLVGPRIKTSGPVLESPQSIASMKVVHLARLDSAPLRWRVSVPTAGDAQHAVDSVAALGADFIKARTYASVETYFAIAAAARRRGLMFVGHPPFGMPIPADVVSDSGQRTLEHGFFPDRVDTLSVGSLARVTAAYVRNGTVLVPTNIAWEGHRIPADSVVKLTPSNSCAPLPANLLRETTRRWEGFASDRRGSKPESASSLAAWNAVLTRHYHDLATLHAQGVRILPGTDIPAFICPEIALNREIEIMVDGVGLTPLEALRSATLYPAELFGLQDSLGTLSVGKLADIVLLDGDPLVDIRNLRRVHATIANGVYHLPQKQAAHGNPRGR